MKKLYVILGIIIIFICLLGTKVSATTEVNSWSMLKSAIESGTDINIKLKPGNWVVTDTTGTITISSREKCYNNNRCKYNNYKR